MAYEKIYKLAALYEKQVATYHELKMLKLDIQYMADHVKDLESRRKLFREDESLEDAITEAKLKLYSLKDELRHKSQEIQNKVLFPRAL